VGVALGNFGCRVELRGGFYTVLDGGLETMLDCGPSYKCSLYWGNTWPLEVVAWWFRSAVECARSWLVRMGSGRLSSSVEADKFGSLGTNTDSDSYWGTPLGVADCGCDKIIPMCGL